ncbi:MAG: hypothetical protein ACYC66_03360 [Chloroflexota bacterium]
MTQPTAAPAAKINFPEKGRTITLIMPWAAGGSIDPPARIHVASLEKELVVSVQVVNREGAGSQVGLTEAAKAKPDGYTLAAVTSTGSGYKGLNATSALWDTMESQLRKVVDEVGLAKKQGGATARGRIGESMAPARGAGIPQRIGEEDGPV